MSDATYYDKPYFTDHTNELVKECAICGSYYPESQLVIRNGLQVCTVADFKSAPCFDERGHREKVTVTPLTPSPLRRKGRFLT